MIILRGPGLRSGELQIDIMVSFQQSVGRKLREINHKTDDTSKQNKLTCKQEATDLSVTLPATR
jgi:hypothetical protein